MGKLNIDDRVLTQFRKFVLNEHGKIRDVLHLEAEKALSTYIEQRAKKDK